MEISNMRNRMRSFIASLAVATGGAAWIVAGPLDAQAPKPAAPAPARATTAAKPWTAPRTPDGKPDLQGFYDVATMTPVERPSGAKNLVLSDEEAAAMEQYEAQRQVKNDAPIAGDRTAPPVGGETSQPKTYL
jgi:hypothetical protein